MVRTSLTEKMILYFLLLGIGSIVFTGVFAFVTARNALIERTYDQLKSIRVARQNQVEMFFGERFAETARLSKNNRWTQILQAHIPGTLCPQTMKFSDSESPETENYSGIAVYSSDGNLIGTYPESLSNHILKQIFPATDVRERSAFAIDFSGIDSTSTPLMIVSPINVNGKPAGYLASIVKNGFLDKLLIDEDPSNGLGYTGETYIVGPDFLMRSRSRFMPSAVMHIRVDNTQTKAALAGNWGITDANDYRNTRVLSAYNRLSINGLKWAILSEIDYSEATATVSSIRNNILLLTLCAAILFFIINYLLSKSITSPLLKLKDAAILLGSGNLNTNVSIESRDEIGELAEAFNRMANNLNEKEQALRAERYNRLRSAIDGQDSERQRLSRELHDGIGQSMIAIRLRLGALENNLNSEHRRQLTPVIELTDKMIDEIRAISNALLPSTLSEFGLQSAIRGLCNSLSESTCSEITLEGEFPADGLKPRARLYLFRIIQEALSNSARHASASDTRIIIAISDGNLRVSIRDNGKGFDPELPCHKKNHGLSNIRERAGLLHGNAEIQSAPGKGTTVLITIPFNRQTL